MNLSKILLDKIYEYNSDINTKESKSVVKNMFNERINFQRNKRKKYLESHKYEELDNKWSKILDKSIQQMLKNTVTKESVKKTIDDGLFIVRKIYTESHIDNFFGGYISKSDDILSSARRYREKLYKSPDDVLKLFTKPLLKYSIPPLTIRAVIHNGWPVIILGNTTYCISETDDVEYPLWLNPTTESWENTENHDTDRYTFRYEVPTPGMYLRRCGNCFSCVNTATFLSPDVFDEQFHNSDNGFSYCPACGIKNYCRHKRMELSEKSDNNKEQ